MFSVKKLHGPSPLQMAKQMAFLIGREGKPLFLLFCMVECEPRFVAIKKNVFIVLIYNKHCSTFFVCFIFAVW